MIRPTFSEALRFWLKLGCISFGGPAGQIAILHQELVERRQWISERRFLHALNYCMLLPGPEAQQLATYIGWLLHKTKGGIAAGVLFVLPSLLVLGIFSWLYMTFGETPWMGGLFDGIKPAVTAMVAHAAWRMSSRTLKHPVLWGIAALAWGASALAHVPFPAIVGVAGLTGYFAHRHWPQVFASSASGHPQGSASPASAATSRAKESVIEDSEGPAAHMRWSTSHGLRLALVFAMLWGLPIAALTAVFGFSHLFTSMGLFFSKAALLTFGGAYAVLPYVVQAAVHQYAWLSTSQMIDGLALGETTPGPLIMVVTFVGFIGAYQAQGLPTVCGAEAPWLWGWFAAVLVAWFTFLPSFFFILVGGPLIESTHGIQAFKAPLTAITAAIVGIIVNMAVFFGYHIFFRADLGWQWTSIALAALAAYALFKLRFGPIRLVLLGATAGLLLKYAALVWRA